MCRSRNRCSGSVDGCSCSSCAGAGSSIATDVVAAGVVMRSNSGDSIDVAASSNSGSCATCSASSTAQAILHSSINLVHRVLHPLMQRPYSMVVAAADSTVSGRFRHDSGLCLTCSLYAMCYALSCRAMLCKLKQGAVPDLDVFFSAMYSFYLG
jgi:hypothetical protein